MFIGDVHTLRVDGRVAAVVLPAGHNYLPRYKVCVYGKEVYRGPFLACKGVAKESVRVRGLTRLFHSLLFLGVKLKCQDA